MGCDQKYVVLRTLEIMNSLFKTSNFDNLINVGVFGALSPLTKCLVQNDHLYNLAYRVLNDKNINIGCLLINRRWKGSPARVERDSAGIPEKCKLIYSCTAFSARSAIVLCADKPFSVSVA